MIVVIWRGVVRVGDGGGEGGDNRGEVCGIDVHVKVVVEW